MEKNELTGGAGKSENRKALPRFIAIIIAALLAGVGLGVGLVKAEEMDLPRVITEAVNGVMTAVAPWGIPVSTAAVMGTALWKYRAAKRKLRGWDGEDEDTADAAEQDLNWALAFTSLQTILSLFFFAVATVYIRDYPWLMASAGLFLLALFLIVVMQQKTVDLVKRINPEKRGSVYDTKFQKKWFESCDEAEQRQIGQAAYAAYTAASRACMTLWVVLVCLGLVFDIGLLPAFSVLAVMGVLHMRYFMACFQMSARKPGTE